MTPESLNFVKSGPSPVVVRKGIFTSGTGTSDTRETRRHLGGLSVGVRTVRKTDRNQSFAPKDFSFRS